MTIKQIAIGGILIAIGVLLTRFVAFQSLTVRVSAGFIAIFFAAYLYGPSYSAWVAALADVAGMLIFPRGSYFIGFTISAFFIGGLYGFLFFHKNKMDFAEKISAIASVCIFSLLINTYVLTWLIGKSFILLVPERAFAAFIMFIAQCIVINMIYNRKNFLKHIKELS